VPSFKQIPLAQKTDPAKTGIVSDERLVNLYAEQTSSTAAGGFYLTAAAGLTRFSTISSGASRGLFALDDEILAVQSQSLYRVTSGGVASRVATIPGSDHIIMAANDRDIDGTPTPQVAIVGSAGVWLYHAGSIDPINMSGFPTPNSVEFIDGYLIFTLADGRFVWSGISDGGTIDALDFASAEGDPDGLLRCLKVRRELYMMGPKTIEVWTHTEDFNAPFQRVPGAVLPVGLLSRTAACVVAGQLFWIDSSRLMRKLSQGYQAAIISNDGLNRALGKVSDIDTVSMFGYVEGGHQFIVVTCPDFTWVYDDTLGVFCERVSYGRTQWQAVTYARAFGKHVVGSNISGNLFTLDNDNKTEDGDFIIATARLPTVNAFPQGGVVHSFDLNIETGVGLLDGSASDIDPEVMFRWSIDGGKRWVAERKAPLGRIGERNRAIRFNGLGEFKEQGIIFEISCAAAVVKNIVSAYIRAAPRK
jgi:hypothetical protein